MPRLALFAALLTLAACSRQPSPTVFIDPALATLVPADTIALAGVRMQQLTKTAFYDRYVAKGRLSIAERFQKETGIDPGKNLWELLAAFDGANTIVLIRGKFSDQGLEPRLDLPGAERFAYKGYTLIGRDAGAVVFLNPTTAAAGTAASLRRLIDNRNAVAGIPKPLEQRIVRIPSTNQAWFAANTAGRVPTVAGPMANFARMLESVQFATGQFDLRQKLLGGVALDCRNEQEAERIRGAIAGLLGFGRLNSPEDDRRENTQVFDGIKVYREGSVVRFSTDLTFEAIESSPFLRPLLGVK